MAARRRARAAARHRTSPILCRILGLLLLYSLCCTARAADARPDRRRPQASHARLSMSERVQNWIGFRDAGSAASGAAAVLEAASAGSTPVRSGSVVVRHGVGGWRRRLTRTALREVDQQGDAATSKASEKVCSLELDGIAKRKVLQINGSADDVAHMLLCPAVGGIPLESMRLVEASTRDDVLSVGVASPSDVHTDVVISEQSGCQNLTLSFAFDKMVGVTNYTLSAREGTAEVPADPQDEADDLCSITLSFLVAGITVYTVELVEDTSTEQESTSDAGLARRSNQYGGHVVKAYVNDPGTHKVIYTGSSASFIVSYDMTLAQPLFTAQALVQFLDGSTSFSTSTSNLHEKLLGLFLKQHHDNETIPVAYNAVVCVPVVLDRMSVNTSGMLSSEECGVAFRETTDPENSEQNGRNIHKLLFGAKLSPYRVGMSQFVLTWDGFASQDPMFEDEEFVTVIRVIVTGSPPPLVLTVRDPGPMFRSGGEEAEVEMANTEGSVNREFIVAGVVFGEVAGSYRDSGDGIQVAKFLSQPGNGTSLGWALRVTYPDGTVKVSDLIQSQRAGPLRYKDDALVLESIVPSSAKFGDAITLSGYFDGFDHLNISDDTHGIFFNNASLHLNSTNQSINADSTIIELLLPDRKTVGSSYEFDVRVLVGGQFTNALTFIYVPEFAVEPSIVVFGASFNQSTQRYEIGSCGSTRYSVSLPQGLPTAEAIRWNIYPAGDISIDDSARDDILEAQGDIINDQELLVITPSAFQNETGIFEVEVLVSVLGMELKGGALIEKLGAANIGVMLLQPQSRGLRVPNAPLRITSLIDVPDGERCVNASAKLIYDWTVWNETRRFSFANYTETSMENSAMPSRLGREYIIPSSKLAYGDLHISLFVFMEDDNSISGFSKVTAQIVPSPLVAKIGNGEGQVAASLFSALSISGDKSFDPDSANFESSASGIDTYMWTCEFSTSLEDAIGAYRTCGTSLLPDPNASTLVVQKEDLITVRDAISGQRGTDGGFRIRYTLQVGKNFRLSSSALQTVVVKPDPFEMATLAGFDITDNEGVAVDWTSIRYYEGLVIFPAGEGKTWRFSVLSPARERNTLLSGSNVIRRPGYYDPGSLEAAQGFPLGFKPYALSPGTTYVIEIAIFDSRAGVEQGISVLSMTTLPRPRLVFPPLPIVSGDDTTLFSAVSSVNLDISHAFLYYYYLVNNEGEEFCVDGCSGSRFVQFYLEIPGTYTLRCELVDSLGKSTLDEVTNNSTLTIRSSPGGLLSAQLVREVDLKGNGVSARSTTTSVYGERLRDLHWSGDHSSLELVVSTMSAHFSRADAAVSSESDFAALDCAVTTMHQVMVNSAPSTRASQSYVRTASRLSAINSVYFATEDVMYTVLSMVDNAVTKVPDTEALQIEKDLQMFYNRSIRHVLAAFTGFTSRVRLQQFGSGSGLDARSLVVDTFRLQATHMTRSTTKGAECGMTKTISTVVPGGISTFAVESQMANAQAARSGLFQSRSANVGSTGQTASLDASYSSQTGEIATHATLTVSILCNKEQGSSMSGEKSTFEWCDSVFNATSGLRGQSSLYKMDPKTRLVFSMMETIDFVWLSGLGLDQRPSDTQFLVTTNVTAFNEKNEIVPVPSARKGCYKLNTTVKRLGVTPNRGCLSVAPFGVQSLQIPFEPKVMMKDYQRNESGVSAEVARDNSSTIVITADANGIFGASGTGCPTKIDPAAYERPQDSGEIVAYTLAGVGAIVAVGTVLTWVSLNALYARAAPV